MKRTVVLITLLSLSILFAACVVGIPEGGETPARVGEEIFMGAYVWCPRLQEGGMSLADSDTIVADVTITGWLDELCGFDTTYFAAQVNNVVCGSIPQDRIVIEESGSSEATSQNGVIFQKGDRLMLVLSQYDADSRENMIEQFKQRGKEIKSWITGAPMYIAWELGICDIVEVDDELFVLDRMGLMIEPAIIANELTAAKNSDEAVSILTKRDAALAKRDFYSRGAIAYDDFAALAKKYCAGD